MKLLIHDYNNEEWNKVAADYEGWEVLSDDGRIKPCAGCFGCWLKTPGECVIKDGYEQMGRLIHEAEEDKAKAKARKYVEAVATDHNAKIKDIRFEECEGSTRADSLKIS